MSTQSQSNEFETVSDIDVRTVEISFFSDKAAQSLRTEDLTLPGLKDRIATQAAATKAELPLLKLAVFGNQRSDKGSLRTNANVLQITGIEVEHDAGEITFDAAVAVMQQVRIRCLLYTTPSYQPGISERWRILVPLSQQREPGVRESFVANINGLFGGKLAPESFVLSQSYYYGHTNNSHHRVEVVDGDFLDLRDDLYAGSFFKDGSRVGDQAAEGSDGGGRQERPKSRRHDDPQPADRDMIEAALNVISSDCSYDIWLKVAAALRQAHGDAGFELFDRWSAKATGNAADGTPRYTSEKSRERWRGARTMTEITIATLFHYADEADNGWRERHLRDRMNHAGAGADEADADAGGQQAADEESDAAEDDERVANEAPVAKALPVIKLHQRISLLTTEAQQMLVRAKVPFYQRGGELVRPIIRKVQAAHGRPTRTAQLKPVSSVYMRDSMCRHAKWMRFTINSGWVPAKAPMDVAGTLLARDGLWPFPEIVGVIACPTMRPDGSLLVKQGYDRATRLLLVEPPPMPTIAEQPTRDDALQALALLEDLLCESPFVDEACKSVALSGLITPVVRGAMPVVPMHAASAPTAGTGKSFLWDMVAAISIGQRRIPVIAAGDEEETEKRLGGILLTGQPLISIDNVNRELKGEFLAQAIEQQFLDLRPLGASRIVRVEAGSTTIFCTGNNITIAGGDLWRRTIIARLDAEIERPQLRQFKFNPIKSILDDRGKYIAACLTICRAYIVAGRPGVLPRLASFEAWSDTVRSALVWLGRADPVDTMEDIRADDPERELLGQVLQGWAKHHGEGAGSDVPLNVIVDTATKAREGGFKSNVPMYPEFNAAVRMAANASGNARVEVSRFGIWCRTNKGRIVDGLRLKNKPSKRGGAATWWVERK